MSRFLHLFQSHEDGAVTVDWVVLTAAIVGLGVAVITAIGTGAVEHSDSVGNRLTSQDVSTY